MGAPRGSLWRGSPGRLLATTAILLLAMAGTAQAATIEAAGGGSYSFYWSPSTASIAPGGSVTFSSSSATVPHGVTWTGGPEKPACSGVPDGEKTSWSGSCTFAQAGTYPFVCSVHPVEMKGSIAVGSSQPPGGPNPPSGGSSESPLQGNASQAVRIAKSQRGSSVRGSVNLSAAGAGGRLKVILLAKRAALAGEPKPGTAQVGKFTRASLKAGRLSFTVPMKGTGRRALSREQKLSLSVKIVITPPGRPALTLRRGVVLHV